MIRTWLGRSSRHNHICRKCNFSIETGDTYRRVVYRISGVGCNRLRIEFEHTHECDYQPDEEDFGIQAACRPNRRRRTITSFPPTKKAA